MCKEKWLLDIVREEEEEEEEEVEMKVAQRIIETSSEDLSFRDYGTAI